MAYKPKIITVPEGGTGASSFTAYTPICGGTSSTNPFQSVASLGNSGDILTSTGASSLPTFQAPGGGGLGYVMNVSTDPGSNALVDGTSYLAGLSATFGLSALTYSGTSTAFGRFYIPKAGTITKCYGGMSCTVGSNENCTMRIYLNDSSSTDVSTTIKLDTTPITFSNTGLSISVSAGDYIGFVFVSPTWGTNPTSARLQCQVYIT